MKKPTDKLFSVPKSEFSFEYLRGTGKGGQKRNKTSSACRCTHKASGAVGYSESSRQQHLNRRTAWLKVVNSEAFNKWLRIENSRAAGDLAVIEEKVNIALRDPDQLKVEVVKNGKWVVEK